MRTNTFLGALGLAALLALCSVSAAQADVVFDVTLDTSALVGGTYFLDFQLNDGDGVQNNSVVLSNFLFDTGSASGSPVLLGGASGTLGAGAIIVDSDFLNELTEGFTPGNTLSFHGDLTTNLAPGALTPDAFSFAILDSNGNEIPTTNPNGSFLSVDINSPTPDVVSSPAVGSLIIPAPVVVVPEPSSFALLGAGMMSALGLLARKRKRG